MPKGRCQSVETVGKRGTSRRQESGGRTKKERKHTHFQSVHFGGFEESQIICYLWETVKSMESMERKWKKGTEVPLGNGAGDCLRELAELEKQMRRRVRVEIRRYFMRRKRRNVRMLFVALAAVVCIVGVFGVLLGVDRVSGESMYPYLNNGDWIVYSRVGGRIQRGEIVVFEKNGENLVKRVAGLPGDTVEVLASGNDVIVNGVRDMTLETNPAGNSYLQDRNEEGGHAADGNADEPGTPLTVLDGQYMVLGDNRRISIDSRDDRVGTVRQKDILGRVILVVRTR